MVLLYYRRSMMVLLLAVLFSAITNAQNAQEFEQGFEGTASSPWNFTPNPAPYEVGDDAWTSNAQDPLIAPANGPSFWYMRDLDNDNGGFDGFHTLDFDNIDVSGFPFNSIIFQYYSFEYEDADSIGYVLAYDGADFDMANYVDLNRNTQAWEVVFINLPGDIASVKLRLMAKQNGGNDYAGFDEVAITSSELDLFAPQVLEANLIDENTVRIRYNEPMNQSSVENIGNYTSSTTISNIAYTDPGDGSSYVDINYAAPFVDGQSNAITVGFVADVTGNVHTDGFTFDFIYNNSTPELVITEIMYNNPGDDDLEFIEIFNASTEAVAAGGLTVLAGNEVTLPELELAPGAVILLALNEAAAEEFYGMDFLDWGDNTLGNGGDEVSITNFSGQFIDQVNYDDASPWPTTPDGDGPSLELIAPNLDNSLGINWKATTTQFGDTEIFATPGTVSEVASPIISFDESILYLQEADGIQSFNVSISNASPTPSLALASEVATSTAIEGEDYLLTFNTLEFVPNGITTLSLDIEILDNNDIGGKYLILELTDPINAEIGSNNRLIILINDNDIVAPVAPVQPTLELSHLGSYMAGTVAEIVAHDPVSQRLYVANAEDNRLEIVDFEDPNSLGPVNSLDLSIFGGDINSVAVSNEVVAVATEGMDTDDVGRVLFFSTDGFFINSVEVGVLPDMLIFTPDGSKLLTANEGEPSDDYLTDPEGSVSIIDLSAGINNVSNADVSTIDLSLFNDQQATLIEQGVRIFGPGATVAQDLEPEYIAISEDGSTAYVSCQENNALIIVDIATATATQIVPLGFKDWTEEGVFLDASNQSPDIFFANWPIYGMYQPDAITTFSVGGQEYIISANEGDARDYDGFTEEFRVQDDEIVLDPDAFPNAEDLKESALLGRLRISSAMGDTDNDGDYDELYAYGARSFSIWNATTGALVYDSGSELEIITANDPVYGALFNSDDEENGFKDRSDDKGPEPEAVAVGMINGYTYAFIGMERVGGVMVYDISSPTSPQFIQYINTRTVDTEGGDLSPEDVIFISADESPNGKNLLVVSYEVSGTVAVFEIDITSTISFAEANAIIEEGAGMTTVSLVVEQAGALSGTAVIDVVSASTAVDGTDYTIGTTTIDFDANDASDKTIELDILDNTDLGGRYLILEFNKEASTVGIGEEDRHILLIQDNDDTAPVAQSNAYVQLNHLGSFELGGDALAEIVAYDGESKRLFVTNSENNRLEIIDYTDPANLTEISDIDLSTYGGGVNSVAVNNGLVAVAVEGENVDDNGAVIFFDTDGTLINTVETGVLPDMVTFTPDGNTVLTANEGEPNDDYDIDPEGSVSIIDISNGAENATVNTIGFTDFNSQQAALIEQGVRIFGPGATVAQDLEPEYIAVSEDGAFAYVVCQENNALAIVDINAQAVSSILPLGTKDWTEEGVTFDASNRTDDIFFANWPIKGIYHPDAIDYFSTGGAGYLITANEGDARDYDGYTEEFRVKDDEIVLDPTAFPDAEYLKDDALLGRLRITAANGDTDGDGDYDELFAYGARSFSIWNATTGELVYDSGNDLEQITASDPVFGALFNSDDEENAFKDRSDDKGPEPEAVVTAEIDGGQYAFIGLERIGGIMVYDITEPSAPVYLQYINTRTVDSLGGDLSPEGLAFIAAADSPTGKPLLSVAYEVSGTVGMFELELNCPITSLPDEVVVCDGDVALLEVAGLYADIQWSNGETTPSIVVDEAGTFSVMATTEGGCMATDTVTVTYVPNPILDLLDIVDVCEEGSILLDAGGEFESYEWSTGDTTQIIEVATTDTYSLTVTDMNGCQAFDNVEVIFNPLPTVNFPLDTTICSTDVYIYEPGDGNIMIINGEEVDNFSTEGLDVGTYSIEATIVNEADCEITVTFSFTIDVCGNTSNQLVFEKVDVFPNPTTGIATIQLSHLQSESYTLAIHTAAGQQVQQFNLEQLNDTYQQTIDFTQMPAGVYFIRLFNESGSRNIRLLVE
jgi:DNA-binding beta-propeller fold protein YncE